MKLRLLAIAALAATASPALAHHPLGGLPMETFAHGALSGVGHPILGFDHLFFVAIMGVAAMLAGLRLAGPAAYIGAMVLGVALSYFVGALPLAEGVIVASLLITGLLVARGKALTAPLALTLFAVFGLFHGSAFAGSLAGQEGGVGGAVLIGYLLGLAASQYLLALAAGWVAEKAFGATEAAATNARLAGAMAAGVGVFLALEMVEGPLVAALIGA